MALITTPAAANADSYATLVEAAVYLAGSPYAASWEAASAEAQEWAMRTGALRIDAIPGAWTGAASTETQALGWPRIGMANRNGFAIASGEIPAALKNAQIEYAKQLLESDLTATNSVAAQGITSIKAGPVALTFKESEEAYAALRQEQTLAAAVPDAVRALLVPSWLYDPRDLDSAYTGLVVESL